MSEKKQLKIVSCRYVDGGNGFTVLCCDEVKGGRATNCSLSVTGYYLPTSEKKVFTAETEEVYDKKYGLQYQVKTFEVSDPTDNEGIVEMIVACKLKGIGRKKAERIVEKFGNNTLSVLDNDFEKLREIQYMPKDLDTPKTQWQQSRDLRQIMSVIGNIVPQAQLLKIKKHFGSQTLEVLKTEPYRTMQVKGINFKIAEDIAKKSTSFKFEARHEERIEAGIKQTLLDGMIEGHLYLTSSQLLQKADVILNKDVSEKVTKVDVMNGVNRLFTHNEIVYTRFTNGECGIYLKFNFDNEADSAKQIVRMLYCKESDTLPDLTDIEQHICKLETSEGIKLAVKQKQAVVNSLTEPVSIVTGGPGRGKTTVLNFILKTYKEFYPKNEILLIAPTGRAARRMAESTNETASTIHSALGLRTDEELELKLPGEEKLPADLIIIDEMSMVDMKLFAILISRINNNCKLVMVGDKDQLSSVGAGNVFAELIASEIIPTTVLDIPFRQDEEDLVFLNAEKINNGDTDLEYGKNFVFIPGEGEEDIANKCITCFQSVLKENGGDLDSIFLLSPFRRRTLIGSDALNKRLQDTININANKLVVNAYGKKFCMGDKVMHTKNISEEDISLSNGDIGYVTDLYAGTDNDYSVTVEYPDVGIKEYVNKDDFDMLELAYGTSVHKAQGSESDVVIIPMSSIFKIMLKRNVIYTAVSRAKRKVYVIGNEDALKDAILNDSYDVRNTLLAWRIKNEVKNYKPESEPETFKQLSFIS